MPVERHVQTYGMLLLFTQNILRGCFWDLIVISWVQMSENHGNWVLHIDCE